MVYSCTRDLTGELLPETCIGHSLIQHCVRILRAHTFITIWFATTVRLATKLTYLMTAYYTPNDGLTANDALFHNNKVR